MSVWVIHIFGGIRAIYSESKNIRVHPDPLDGQILEIPSTSFHGIVNRVKALNLSVVGIEVLDHKWEFDGLIPPKWRPFHERSKDPYILFGMRDKWSEIGHAAHKRQMGELWDLAARISYQIQTCVQRLYEVSKGYGTQLWSLSRRKRFKLGSRFDDARTQTVYLAIQALLIDACVLRDYLAEFAARYIYADTSRAVTTLNGLRKYLSQKPELTDALSEELRQSTGENGWLNELADYRNLVVHSTPLATAKEHLLLLCEGQDLPTGVKLPSLCFPLPLNPGEIISARGDGNLFKDYSKMVQNFLGASDPQVQSKDALQYLHGVLEELANLSERFSTFSPVVPEIPILTDDDLVGPIQWHW